MQILSKLKRLHYSFVTTVANTGINRSLRHGNVVEGYTVLKDLRFGNYSKIVCCKSAHLALTLTGSCNKTEEITIIPALCVQFRPC